MCLKGFKGDSVEMNNVIGQWAWKQKLGGEEDKIRENPGAIKSYLISSKVRILKPLQCDSISSSKLGQHYLTHSQLRNNLYVNMEDLRR